MYAIIEACGRQYKVCEGETVFIEKIEGNIGDSITFDKVIMVSDDKNVKIGNPTVNGASVQVTIENFGKHKKIIVFTYKAKKNVKRKQGHRQPYTKIKIEKINM